MRVLVAGRNAKVLAKAAGTFVHDLEIHTAATKAACFALLQRVEFDLIVACETLGDGSGLEVLSHVAVNTPNTLRIFAARPATLNLLKGELGLFGLFRTLPYPINFQKLWAAINLARGACDEPAPTAPSSSPMQDVILEETWDGSDVDVVAVARKEPAPAAPARTAQPRQPQQQQIADGLHVTSAARISLAPAATGARAVSDSRTGAATDRSQTSVDRRAANAAPNAANPRSSQRQSAAALANPRSDQRYSAAALANTRGRPQPTAPSVAARPTQTSPREQSQKVAPQDAFTDIRVTATTARGRPQPAKQAPTAIPTRTTADSALRQSTSAQHAASITSTRVSTTAARRLASVSQSPAATPQRGAAAAEARRQAQPASAQQATTVTAARGAAATARRQGQPAKGQQVTATTTSGGAAARATAAATKRQTQPAQRQQEITSGMRAAARYAAAHSARDVPAKPTRIPETDAFKRARARRDSGRVEPIVNGESLAQLAKAALTKRPQPQYRGAPAGKTRAAWYVGSGVFAATTAAVLTFFMVNANNSIKQPKLPMMASITQPVSNKVFPWQPETQQPTRQAAFMRSEAPASTVADIQAEAEAASESPDGDPDHPGPPPPYSPPPPSEPPSLEAPAQWVDE